MLLSQQKKSVQHTHYSLSAAYGKGVRVESKTAGTLAELKADGIVDKEVRDALDLGRGSLGTPTYTDLTHLEKFIDNQKDPFWSLGSNFKRKGPHEHVSLDGKQTVRVDPQSRQIELETTRGDHDPKNTRQDEMAYLSHTMTAQYNHHGFILPESIQESVHLQVSETDISVVSESLNGEEWLVATRRRF